MGQAYDDTCPRCHEPAPRDGERICCGVCLRYHHAACWLDACAGCGATTTLSQKDATRRRERDGLMAVLIGLTIAEVIAGGLALLLPVGVSLGGPIGIDPFGVLAIALLVPIFVVLTRMS